MTHARIRRAPWLSVMETDGSLYTYCGPCGAVIVEEWSEHFSDGARAWVILADPIRAREIDRSVTPPRGLTHLPDVELR